ncbi:olfactomedin-4-like [Thalassophryne amazonica]|uniref:olfactomedin-4-like n=1 Tax=Thalassophryne amazonica TaxID=390379 RepID=UPI001471E102|nr:olfactomedin-4-like [Thalassophryne amazonica]
MNLFVIAVLLCHLIICSQQASPLSSCVCELKNSQKPFPYEQLASVNNRVSDCNNNVTPQEIQDLDTLLLGLERRVPQLQADLSMLEKEDDGDLYGVLSLHIIENELIEINQLINRLNSTTMRQQRLSATTSEELQDLKAEMEKMKIYDTLQVVKRQKENQRLKRDLVKCKNGLHPTAPPTEPARGVCPHGPILNVTGPRDHTPGEYPGSYKYGAWGRDPKPEAGKENWYWLVMLTSGNKYSNYVRLYSTLSNMIVGISTPGNVQIHASNPTTNTIQGPNVVLYGNHLYYNCYNEDYVCKFNLTSKTVSKVQLPKGTRYNAKANFCHLDECYPLTDLDLATDESGVWVIYTTTQDFGNLVVSRLDGEVLTINQTWHTTLYKQAVTNTFMACGVLYATRYISKDMEEIFYSFDTATGRERFDIGIKIRKMAANIYSINYSPVDQMLHVYSDSVMTSYEVIFG